MNAIQCQSCGRSFPARSKDFERCPLCGEWADNQPAAADAVVDGPPPAPKVSDGGVAQFQFSGGHAYFVCLLVGGLIAFSVARSRGMGGDAAWREAVTFWERQSAPDNRPAEPGIVRSGGGFRLDLNPHQRPHVSDAMRQGKADASGQAQAQTAPGGATTLPTLTPDPLEHAGVRRAIGAFKGKLFVDESGTWATAIQGNEQAYGAIEWEIGAFDYHGDEARLMAGFDAIHSRFVLGK